MTIYYNSNQKRLIQGTYFINLLTCNFWIIVDCVHSYVNIITWKWICFSVSSLSLSLEVSKLKHYLNQPLWAVVDVIKQVDTIQQHKAMKLKSRTWSRLRKFNYTKKIESQLRKFKHHNIYYINCIYYRTVAMLGLTVYCTIDKLNLSTSLK